MQKKCCNAQKQPLCLLLRRSLIWAARADEDQRHRIRPPNLKSRRAKMNQNGPTNNATGGKAKAQKAGGEFDAAFDAFRGNFPQLDLPALRDLADKGTAQARDAYARFKTAAEEAS